MRVDVAVVFKPYLDVLHELEGPRGEGLRHTVAATRTKIGAHVDLGDPSARCELRWMIQDLNEALIASLPVAGSPDRALQLFGLMDQLRSLPAVQAAMAR